MNLEIPKKFKGLVNQANLTAQEIFRPISRKYDLAEHEYPKELDMFAALMDGMNAGNLEGGAGAGKLSKSGTKAEGMQNGSNMATVLGLLELCYGDVGLALSLPRQGLGNAAIASVANDEQLERFAKSWASMAITEPSTGSDSSAIRTTAKKDGDYYILNGEKIFVTSGERSDSVVVWATLDRELGKAAIKSFVVEKGTPGLEVVRLEKKLGIKASDTATIMLTDCRVHKDNLLGKAEVDPDKGFGGVMETFDNTRPVVAAMALGCTRAALEETKEVLKDSIDCNYSAPINCVKSAEADLYRMEADYEMARLLTLKAAWMADNKTPNSLEASMSKAKAGRVGNAVTLKCVELASSLGYTEGSLLEKWSRDSKILDIFEGTQQIQQLIVARRLLGKSSSELK